MRMITSPVSILNICKFRASRCGAQTDNKPVIRASTTTKPAPVQQHGDILSFSCTAPWRKATQAVARSVRRSRIDIEQAAAVLEHILDPTILTHAQACQLLRFLLEHPVL